MLFNRAYTADSTCEKKGKLPTWVIDYQHNYLFVLILFPFLKEEVKLKKKKCRLLIKLFLRCISWARLRVLDYMLNLAGLRHITLY